MKTSITNPKSWARINKRSFANELITSMGVEPQNEPAAFFMAGLPGAGKTEFTINLINDLQLRVVRIDMDEIATKIDGYRAEEASAFREAASDMLNAVFDKASSRKVDFIMDGTFRSKSSINNIERVIKKGYHVKVFYVHQEPQVAWEFTKAREKIEKRSIDKQGFIDAYFEIQNNISKLMSMNLSNLTLDLVIKDKDNKIGMWYDDVNTSRIDDILNSGYNREVLQETLL